MGARKRFLSIQHCSVIIASFLRRSEKRDTAISTMWLLLIVAIWPPRPPCLFDTCGLSCRIFPSISTMLSNHTETITESLASSCYAHPETVDSSRSRKASTTLLTTEKKQTWPAKYQMMFYQNQNYSPQLAHSDKMQKRPNDDT